MPTFEILDLQLQVTGLRTSFGSGSCPESPSIGLKLLLAFPNHNPMGLDQQVETACLQISKAPIGSVPLGSEVQSWL